MDKNLSIKIGDKWQTFGKLAKNQWGNEQVSFKVTPELIQLMQSKQGGWLNFSLFEAKPKSDKPSQHNKAKADGYAPAPSLDDEIPFN